ncbi:hypothetical protein Hanom_Chr07g00588721 [Helianthus anomalus]
MCGEVNESSEHLFVSCGLAQADKAISSWCKVPPIYALGLKDILELHIVGSSPKFKKTVHVVCLSAIWCIWKARNECVFKQNRWSLEKIMGDVKTLSLLWVKGRSKHAGLNWEIWRAFNLNRASSLSSHLAPVASGFLKRVQKAALAHATVSVGHSYVFSRVGFAIQKGVAAQLVARLPTHDL